jgi:hypothetical protein
MIAMLRLDRERRYHLYDIEHGGGRAVPAITLEAIPSRGTLCLSGSAATEIGRAVQLMRSDRPTQALAPR